jgi:hypothetical protein
MAKIPEADGPLELTGADLGDPAPPVPAAIRRASTAPLPIYTIVLDR